MDDLPNSNEITEIQVDMHINLSITPIYADEIIQFNFDKGVAKLLLAQRFQNAVMHTNTIAVPLETILSLRDLLNSDEFGKAIQAFEDAKNLKM